MRGCCTPLPRQIEAVIVKVNGGLLGSSGWRGMRKGGCRDSDQEAVGRGSDMTPTKRPLDDGRT